ncbi:peptidoglycan DD-metalloendopeptidase family protein [Candidatus Kuenenbacteria bacterium]|nr:peptidoglycan DD-metalloendopeptidase family protein [Candidatus Kuenenbacteria bacterium]
MQIKKILIKSLAAFFRNGAKFSKFLLKKLGFLRTGAYYFGRAVFKIGIFPIYKFFYFIKHKALNVYAPAKSKVFYVLNKAYLVHILIVIIGLAVTMNSISAKELREDSYGEKAVIYSVISKEEVEELTEETQVLSSSGEILSYLDKTGSVESQKTISSQQPGAGEQLITELSTVTEGGAAVVKPNIIQAIDITEVPIFDTGERQDVTIYVVQSGENVSAIANRFGVSVETILWQNGLGINTLIRAGDKLEILPVTGVTHKVKRGENIGAIAKKYGVEQDKIISYNNLFDVNDIQINQNLVVPGGKKVSPYVSNSTYTSSQVPAVSPISKLFVPPSKISSGSGMLWPTSVRRISQYYSWRHRGLDIAGPSGTPLYAAEAGTVERSGWSNGYGYNVIINHGNGVKTLYGHASKLYVSKGEKVAKGQTIAAMGSTGWSTGPHIHFEVIVGGVKKNPLSYVK